jgi:hypothetical protein
MSAPARVSALAIVAICTVFAFAGPLHPGSYVFEDHRVDASAVRHMKSGDGYYRAMNRAMIEAKVGPVHEARSFRTPTIFLLWRWLPGSPPGSLWIPFVVMVGVTGMLLVRYTTAPLVIPAVVLYLIITARTTYGGIYLMVEFWAAPFTAATLVAWRCGRPRRAAGFALAAFLVRELTGGLLLGGLVEAWRRRRDRVAWLVAVGLAVVATAVHWTLASSYLVAHGHEAPLLGTSRFPSSLLTALSFELPGPQLLWVPVWLMAVVNLVRRRELVPVALFVALPITALWIGRPYWMLVTIPFVLVWAAELLTEVGLAKGSGRPVRRLYLRTSGAP